MRNARWSKLKGDLKIIMIYGTSQEKTVKALSELGKQIELLF